MANRWDRWRRSIAMVVCGVGVLLGAASPALAQWPAGDYRCFRIGDGSLGYGMWKSQDAQSYSPIYGPVGNLNRFVVIPVEPNVVKIMDWQGYFLTSNGDLIYPTRDWRGHASSWRYAEFLRGKLLNIQYERYARNDLGVLYLRATTEAFGHELRTHYLGQQEGNCPIQFGLGTAATEIRATAGSPTPLVRLFQTGGVVPGWFEINWGDGSPAVTVSNFSGANPGTSTFTRTRLVPNADTCSFGSVLLGWPPGQCIITDRHIYENEGNYEITLIVGTEEFPARRGLVVRIPVTITPSVGNFNVLSIGDSLASGEGAPTWTSTPNTDPIDWVLRSTFGYPLDSAVWEARFIQNEPADADEAHRSYYAGPALATQLLQEERRDIAVRLQHLAWSGSWVDNGNTNSLASLIGQVRAVQVSETTPYDVILASGGANDVGLPSFTRGCVTDPTPCSLTQTNLDSMLGLPAKYDALATQIAASPITAQAHVIVTGVFEDVFSGSNSILPILCEPETYGVEPSERILIAAYLRTLNEFIESSAAAHGWTYVSVDFTGHGLCAPTGARWINTVLDSFYVQATRAESDLFGLIFNGITLDGILNGSFFSAARDWASLFNMSAFTGAFHPGYGGHRHYAEQILIPLRGALDVKYDRVPPTLTPLANIVSPATGPGGAVLGYVVPTASDDRDPSPVVVCAPPSGSTVPLGTPVVTCTATDAAGNSAVTSFGVTVVDTTPPSVSAVGIVVAAIVPTGTHGGAPNLADSMAVATFLNSGSAIDAVDPHPVRQTPVRVDCGNPSIVLSPLDASYLFPVGVTCVRFSYEDAANNIGTAVASVTVTPPVGGVVTGPGIPVTATDSSNVAQPVTLTFLGSAAPGLLQANPIVPPPAVPAGFQIVGTAYEISTTSAFTGPIQVCFSGALAAGDVIYHNGMAVAPTTVSGGSACGVVSSLSPFMVVRPTSTTTKLVAHAGDDQVVEAHGPNGARVKLKGSSTPVASGKQKRLYFRWTEGTTLLGSGAIARATLSIGRHVLTLSVTNHKGLSASDTVEVVVRDTTAPRLRLGDGVVREIATSPAGAPVLFHWRAIDRVDGELPVTCSPASGEVFPIGKTTVTCNTVDASGNGATASFTVKVRPLPTPQHR